jgi:competence protein ComEC
MQWTSAPNIGEAPLPQRARGFWKERFSTAGEGLERLLEAERTQLPPWLAIGFGTGIAAWFALDSQAQWQAFLCIASALSLIGFSLAKGRASRALGWFALAAAIGCALIWARATGVEQPRLARATVTELAGTVEKVENIAAKQNVRLTLSTRTENIPPRIRVTVPMEEAKPGLEPGAEVSLRARLMPPSPMALPGTYDFARDAWFRGLGAVGTAVGPVTVIQAGEEKACRVRAIGSAVTSKAA